MAHLKPNDYYPGLLPEPTRTDLAPLHVVQPEGPSFRVTDENCVSWQKWRFRVGFNYREGTVIHDVRYDGRPLFYRLSVSEMTVPYGGKQLCGTGRLRSQTDSLHRPSKPHPPQASLRSRRCRRRELREQSRPWL